MISKIDYQLKLTLDLEEDPHPGPLPRGEGGNEEARRREEQARKLFEDGESKPGWFEEYEELVRGGWPFRAAIYIAWAASPRNMRSPKTLEDLAHLMGLNSQRAIHTWRAKNPAINEQVALMQAAPLLKHRADVMQALVEMAAQPDYKAHNDRKLFFEMTGDYVRRGVVKTEHASDVDLSGLSDGELMEWLGGDSDQPHPLTPSPEGEGGEE